MGMIAEHCEAQELREAAAEVRGPLMICGGIPGWPESLLPMRAYKEWGIKVVIYPLLALYAASRAIREVNELLKGSDLISQVTAESNLLDFNEFDKIIRTSFWSSLAEKYERK
jgi:2-methylisocitrate lyase-like PEP mutase family enzyme